MTIDKTRLNDIEEFLVYAKEQLSKSDEIKPKRQNTLKTPEFTPHNPQHDVAARLEEHGHTPREISHLAGYQNKYEAVNPTNAHKFASDHLSDALIGKLRPWAQKHLESEQNHKISSATPVNPRLYAEKQKREAAQKDHPLNIDFKPDPSKSTLQNQVLYNMHKAKNHLANKEGIREKIKSFGATDTSDKLAGIESRAESISDKVSADTGKMTDLTGGYVEEGANVGASVVGRRSGEAKELRISDNPNPHKPTSEEQNLLDYSHENHLPLIHKTVKMMKGSNKIPQSAEPEDFYGSYRTALATAIKNYETDATVKSGKRAGTKKQFNDYLNSALTNQINSDYLDKNTNSNDIAFMSKQFKKHKTDNPTFTDDQVRDLVQKDMSERHNNIMPKEDKIAKQHIENFKKYPEEHDMLLHTLDLKGKQQDGSIAPEEEEELNDLSKMYDIDHDNLTAKLKPEHEETLKNSALYRQFGSEKHDHYANNPIEVAQKEPEQPEEDQEDIEQPEDTVEEPEEIKQPAEQKKPELDYDAILADMLDDNEDGNNIEERLNHLQSAKIHRGGN
jgi:hypothetical protein